MNKIRESRIKETAREIAEREYRQGHMDKSVPSDLLNKIECRELANAATYETLPWLKQDICVQIYIYSLLRVIGETHFQNIIAIFQRPEIYENESQELVKKTYPMYAAQSEIQISQQIEDFLYAIDNPTDNQGYGINKTLNEMLIPADHILPGLNTSAADILSALDFIPVAWRFKRELLEWFFNRYTKTLTELKKRPQSYVVKPRRDLSTFNRIDQKNPDEVEWAAHYFKKHIVSIHGSLQKSVGYAYDEAMNYRDVPQTAYAATQAMLTLWNGTNSDRMLFDTHFSRALSQRRHKAKHKSRVPLSTHISPESRSQLKKLATRKQKTQYEVLEELIYQAYKNG